LEGTRQKVYKEYLGRFREEFDELNEENQTLRKELDQLASKKREDRSERLSNRSSIKPKSSINSVYGDENRRTHTKATHRPASPNMLLKKKEPKLTESSAFLGRSQIQSPINQHKRRESQLT
jgi:hypothetical protein